MKIRQQINEKLQLTELVTKLTGLNWKPVGVWQDLEECPFCGGHDCFRYHPNTNTAYCFQHYKFYDNVSFYAEYKNISLKDAARELSKELKLTFRETSWDINSEIYEVAQEYLSEKLFTVKTKYRWGGVEVDPLEYLTDIRRHSVDAILNFRLGFNDGGLLEYLLSRYNKDVLIASGLMSERGVSYIPEKCFTYPVIVEGEIILFRVKDPTKEKKFQMPKVRDYYFYNQDVLKQGMSYVVVTEGEDDVISLYDQQVPAIATLGVIQKKQIDYLSRFNIGLIYLAFDNDEAGRLDTEKFIRGWSHSNILIFQLPEGQDVDDVLRAGVTFDELKIKAVPPKPEQISTIRVMNNSYFRLVGDTAKRLTNWIFEIKEIIILNTTEEGNLWLGNIITEDGKEIPCKIPASSFSSSSKLRDFLLGYSDVSRVLYFKGSDQDLAELVHYFSITYTPRKVIGIQKVGDVEVDGKRFFLAGNCAVMEDGTVVTPVNGAIPLGDILVKPVELVVHYRDTGAEMPMFDFHQPLGGVDKFKEHVFHLMIKNRDLRIALAVGWLKATLWSNDFFDIYKFFPLLIIHGKYSYGKTTLGEWLMSMLGMRRNLPELLSSHTGGGTTDTGLGRRLNYYSALPVFCDDYREDDEEEMTKYHAIFRGVFNRASATKGLASDWGVRRVVINGCLMVTGENLPADPALISRAVTVEIDAPGDIKTYKEISKHVGHFNSIGLSWVQEMYKKRGLFLKSYEEIVDEVFDKVADRRVAEVYSVVLAALRTEPFFERMFDKLFDYTVEHIKDSIEERLKYYDIISRFWEALVILHNHGDLKKFMAEYSIAEDELRLHIPSILSAIAGKIYLRKYKLPNAKEILKLLKTEKYFIETKKARIGEKVVHCVALQGSKLPDEIKQIFEIPSSGGSHSSQERTPSWYDEV